MKRGSGSELLELRSSSEDSSMEMSLLQKQGFDDSDEKDPDIKDHRYHHLQKIGLRDLSECPALRKSWQKYYVEWGKNSQKLVGKITADLSNSGLTKSQSDEVIERLLSLYLEGDNPRPPLTCSWKEIPRHPEASKDDGSQEIKFNQNMALAVVKRTLVFFICWVPLVYALFNGLASVWTSTEADSSAGRAFWVFDGIAVLLWCMTGLYSTLIAHKNLVVPAPPKILQLIPGHGFVELYWDKPPGALLDGRIHNYTINCVEHPDVYFTCEGRAVRVSGLRHGHSYRFRVLLRTVTGKKSEYTYFNSIRLPMKDGELHQLQKQEYTFLSFVRDHIDAIFWLTAGMFVPAAIILLIFVGSRHSWLTYFGMCICFGTPVWVRILRNDHKRTGFLTRYARSIQLRDGALKLFILVIVLDQFGDWAEKSYNTSNQFLDLHNNPNIQEDLIPEWILIGRFISRMSFEFVVVPHTYYIALCLMVILSKLFRRVDELKRIILDENSDDEQIVKNIQETHKILRAEFPEDLQKWATLTTIASLFWMATFLFGWVTAHNVGNWSSYTLVYHVGHFGSLCLVVVTAMARVNEKAILLPKLIHMDGPKSLPWSMERMKARIEMRRDLSRLPIQLRVDVIAWFPRYVNIKTTFQYIATGILGALVFQENLLLFT